MHVSHASSINGITMHSWPGTLSLNSLSYAPTPLVRSFLHYAGHSWQRTWASKELWNSQEQSCGRPQMPTTGNFRPVFRPRAIILKTFREDYPLILQIQTSDRVKAHQAFKQPSKRKTLRALIHKRTSLAHVFNCVPCNRRFNSEETLQQHLRDSPAHVPSFGCDDCDRSFDSEEALQQHPRDSPIHQQDTETPLDVFFHSFPTFDYDPSLPPATSYTDLRRHEGWHRGSAVSDDAWNKYQDALNSELHMWYGVENDLTAWHALCRAIGVEPLPTTSEQCDEVVRRTHVNIVDLIEWGRSGSEEKAETFRDITGLRAYTKETDKIFRNTFDQEGGHVVLRHLLRKIFKKACKNLNTVISRPE
ncbi:hypothetical protein BOTCAL_0302g00190 [Botryotinia calthae]|uniref:C2H2-type domain-containing protein n=1 Tax=Botryotinia calthae TaxID=38488 RepID=A0A4Y8CWZ2_9HELO|nr:hypothetical protein BOTCAL_0302g00190 [Botryotinia calthae]